LYEGFFRLPDVGTHDQANERELHVMTAAYDSKLMDSMAVTEIGSFQWTVISRLDQKLWNIQ
jgi:hypothetical protein